MNALKMNERITIQNSEIIKVGGVQQQVWVDKATVWSRVFTVRASEFYSANTQVNEEVLRFVIRPVDSLEITSKMRIKFNGLAYNIISALNDNFENETITIVTKGYGEKITT